MALPSTRCPYCKMGFCLPSDYDKHIKVCPQRSSTLMGSKPAPKSEEDDGPGLGTAIAVGVAVPAFCGGESEPEESGGSCGGGDLGGGGASDSFGD